MKNLNGLTLPPYVAPPARKPSRATRYIRQAAEFARASGCIVECDSSMGTVSIVADGVDCFMQGDDADTFIGEVRSMCKRYPSLPEDVAELCLANHYIECLS